MRWIEPSTKDTISAHKDSKIIIYPLAFTIDNSETDYELKIQYKELADSFGVRDYRVCECLNDKEGFAKVIIDLANQVLQKHTTQQIAPAKSAKKPNTKPKPKSSKFQKPHKSINAKTSNKPKPKQKHSKNPQTNHKKGKSNA